MLGMLALQNLVRSEHAREQQVRDVLIAQGSQKCDSEHIVIF